MKLKRSTKFPRRALLKTTLAGLASGSLAATSAVAASAEAKAKQNSKRRGVFPPDAPAADVGYSPGIAAEGQRVICVSGQGPRDLSANMETQMRQTFERIASILAVAGAAWENVVMMRAYFVNLARDLPVYRKVRKEFLVKPYPASTAVGVTELAGPGLQIEIEAVAIL